MNFKKGNTKMKKIANFRDLISNLVFDFNEENRLFFTKFSYKMNLTQGDDHHD